MLHVHYMEWFLQQVYVRGFNTGIPYQRSHDWCTYDFEYLWESHVQFHCHLVLWCRTILSLTHWPDQLVVRSLLQCKRCKLESLLLLLNVLLIVCAIYIHTYIITNVCVYFLYVFCVCFSVVCRVVVFIDLNLSFQT